MLATIRADENVQLVSLTGESLRPHNTDDLVNSAPPIVAHPVAAPPTADALSSSADLYYEVDKRQLGLLPGQRIGVELPLRGVPGGTGRALRCGA